MLQNKVASYPKIKIVVTGEGGVGKSTLVNTLVGMNITKTADITMVGSMTKITESHEVVRNGIRVIYVDTPGLGDLDIADKNTLHEARKQCEDVDLFLFCMKINDGFTANHINDIRAITNIFGMNIWKRGMFVLTFANEIVERETYNARLRNRESEVRTRIKQIIDLEVAEKIPIVPAGFRKPQLPDRLSWVSEFWIQGFRRMTFVAMYHLIVLNKERIHEAIDDMKLVEQNPEDQPLIACEMSKKDDSQYIRGFGTLVGAGAGLLSATLVTGPGAVILAPFSSTLGGYVGNWATAQLVNFFGWDTEEVRCSSEVILYSLYEALKKDNPDIAKKLFGNK